jgi:DNA invertase Pin-like site-specific DNA recombinase
MKNAIELIRVSTEKQARDDRAGIPAQREANRRTARAYALNIVKTIEIIDVSGAAVLSSPEMQELLRLMESPKIHGVVTKEFSRLIRPEKFTDYALLQQFIDTQTVLYLPDGPIDLASKSGRLLGTVRAAIAGVERQEIVSRMQDAKESMRRAGKHPGGESSLPFGVGYAKEKGWFYTAEAEKVRQAFVLFLHGETSYTRIGRRLNIPRTNVRFILENPIYTGCRVYDKKRDPSPLGYVPRPDGRQGHRRKMSRSPDEIIRVKVLDELISEEEFFKVQDVIDLKRRKHWRSQDNKPHRYTYNGFLTCGDCHSLLYTHTSKDEYYQCKSVHPRERRKRELVGLDPCDNRYMLRKKLEPKLDALFGEKLRDPEFLNRVVEDYNDIQEAKSAPVAKNERALASKLSALSEKRQRVIEAFFEGVITKAERDSKIAEIDRERNTFQTLLIESIPQPGQPSVDEIRIALEPLAEWEFLEREDKRLLLQTICPEISVFRYTVKTLTLNLGAEPAGCNEVSHLKTAPSRFRARRLRSPFPRDSSLRRR